MVDSMVSILLPVILFIVTLVIILALRENDARKRGITNVKKLTDQYRSEMENQRADFKSEVTELEQVVALKDTQLKELIQNAAEEIEHIRTYVDDMSNLRHAMDTYKDALTGLAKLTTDADAKVSQIESDVERFKDIHNTIETFRLDMKDADEHLKQHESTVIQLQKDVMTHLEETIESFRVETDKKLNETKSGIQQLYVSLDEKVDTTKSATEILHSATLEFVNSIGDRVSEQQTLAEEIENLTKVRDELFKTVENLRNEITEKKSHTSELDVITREKAEYLSELNDNIEKAEIKRDEIIKSLAKSDEQISVPEMKSEKIEFDEEPVDFNQEIEVSTPLPEEFEIHKEEKVEESTEVANESPVVEESETEELPKEEVIIEEDSKENIEYYGEEEEIVF